MGTADKKTFAGWVRTNNTCQIIIMGHGDSLSYFILSWCNLASYSDVLLARHAPLSNKRLLKRTAHSFCFAHKDHLEITWRLAVGKCPVKNVNTDKHHFVSGISREISEGPKCSLPGFGSAL